MRLVRSKSGFDFYVVYCNCHQTNLKCDWWDSANIVIHHVCLKNISNKQTEVQITRYKPQSESISLCLLSCLLSPKKLVLQHLPFWTWYRWLWWASCASPSWDEKCGWVTVYCCNRRSVKASFLHNPIIQPHVPSFSHHTVANTVVQYDSAPPSWWISSPPTKAGAKRGRQKEKVRAKQINLPCLTIRCQCVAGAELAQRGIVWHRFKVIMWRETIKEQTKEQVMDYYFC